MYIEIMHNHWFRLFSADRVTAVEISAMLPAQSGDKQPDDMTKWLLESLLMIMVSEVGAWYYQKLIGVTKLDF